MKAPLSKYPALPVATGIIIGILLQTYGFGIISLIVSISAFAVLYAVKRHYVAFYFLMITAGCAVAWANQLSSLDTTYCNKYCNYTAKILSIEDTDYGTRGIVEIDSINGSASQRSQALIYFRGLSANFEKGQTVSFQAKMIKMLDADTTPKGKINYDKYYLRQGISTKAYVASDKVKIVKDAPWYDRWANAARNQLFNGIVFSPIDGGTASFLVASILGDDSFITRDQYSNFRASGVAHVLALSGMHVGVIVSLLSIVFFPLNIFRRGRYIKSILAIILIWLYAVITGLSPSVTRAAIMVSIMLCGFLLQRSVFTFNSLCLAAALILIFSPQSLFQVGFQMSFIAVASILMFMGILPMTLKRRPLLFYVLSSLILPIAAMLGTGIISAYYFHTLPILFLFSNIIVGIIFPWLLSIGILLMITTMLGGDWTWVGAIADVLYWLMDKSIDFIASLGFSHIENINFTAWSILPYALGLISLAWALKKIVDDSDNFSKYRPLLIYSLAFFIFSWAICLI